MKGTGDLRSVRDVRSMRSITRRAVPRVASSSFLELYMLQKEKERLEKEAALIQKRDQSILKRLFEVRRDMDELKKHGHSKGSGSGDDDNSEQGPAKKKKWKKMLVHY